MKKILNRSHCLAFIFIQFVALAQKPMSDLKTSVKYPIGAAINISLLTKEENYQRLCENEFVGFTSENDMKMAATHPSENSFNFEKADKFVAFAQTQSSRIHGHTLVWHQNPPKWMSDFQGTPQQWEEMLKNHVKTVVRHFKGKVKSWDVANEVFNDDGTRRNSIWEKNIPDFVAKSFLWAREEDPEVLLFYNDYGHEYSTRKLEAILAMVKDFKKRNIPIDGLGLQMHTSIQVNQDKLITAINECANTGLKVHIAELDIAVNPKNDSLFVYSEEVKSKQLEIFQLIFKTYGKIPANQQFGITFWNLTDKDNWLRRTYKRPKEYPLLFDDNYQRKDIYKELVSFLYKNNR